ncbi:MAG: hypothetical protein KAY38_03680 [Acinetobacter sp.]|nr:hypothetical protein [Acinetobacter sp.]
MHKDVKYFISEFYNLIKSVDINSDYKLSEYIEAYNNNGDLIDIDNGLYIYGSCDRGSCEIIFQSANISDCMYFLIRALIHSYAFNYELNHRKVNQDARIMGFGMMLYYINKFNKKAWVERLYSELIPIIRLDELDENLILKIANFGKI